MACPHGVYGDGWGCQQCQPPEARENDRPVPVLPRSSADPLNTDRTTKIDSCQTCGCIRTYYSDCCAACSTPFPVDGEGSRAQGTANAHAMGVCPKCSSTVHFEKNAKTWTCADCDHDYAAPKRQPRA